MEGLREIAIKLRARLERSNLAREETLKTCREVIQRSSLSIRAIHRGEFDTALSLIEEARLRVFSVKKALKNFPEIFQAGYVHDSQKEYVEAETMRSIVCNIELKNPEELGVEPAAYLNGIAEAASECRRFVLDRMREGDMGRAEAVLKIMDDIYFELTSVDFPDAITGGLRRTTDALRAVLERTRGDLTLTLSQNLLERAIKEARFDRT